MFFLREFCQTSSVLKVILFISELINIVRFIVPIGLIIMVSIDFGKNVINGKDDDMKKHLSVAIKRIMMAVVVFFIPTVISFVNGIVDDLGVTYSECFDSANKDDIEAYEAEEINEKALEEQSRKNPIISDIDSSNPYLPTVTGNCLPDDEKNYPLKGTDMNGNKTNRLEVDGKYLTSSEMDSINEYILNNVEACGDDWGLRVAGAGYALIYGLSEKGLRLHYQKGGSTTDGQTNGVNVDLSKCKQGEFCKRWGLKISNTMMGYKNSYTGLDCTGFVRWSINVGCGYDVDYQYGDGYSEAIQENYKNIEPGDVLARNDGGHVILALKVNDDGSIFTGESTSGYDDIGTMLNRYKYGELSNYKVIKLGEAYKQYCKK